VFLSGTCVARGARLGGKRTPPNPPSNSREFGHSKTRETRRANGSAIFGGSSRGRGSPQGVAVGSAGGRRTPARGGVAKSRRARRDGAPRAAEEGAKFRARERIEEPTSRPRGRKTGGVPRFFEARVDGGGRGERRRARETPRAARKGARARVEIARSARIAKRFSKKYSKSRKKFKVKNFEKSYFRAKKRSHVPDFRSGRIFSGRLSAPIAEKRIIVFRRRRRDGLGTGSFVERT
jgi:hypothetical protein